MFDTLALPPEVLPGSAADREEGGVVATLGRSEDQVIERSVKLATLDELRIVGPLGPGPSGTPRRDRHDPTTPGLSVAAGQVVGLIGAAGYGLTRLGLTMLAEHAHLGTVAYLDVRGWMSPLSAWEAGIPEDRLIVVRCEGPVEWGRVGSTLLEGVVAMYAEVPRGVKDAQLRTLATLARTRGAPLILRPLAGDLPGGVTQLRLDARRVTWEGAEDGHGAISRRHMLLEASGKAMRGMTRTIEMEDNGADALRVVSGLAAASSGYAAG